jgi:hypothetical protein
VKQEGKNTRTDSDLLFRLSRRELVSLNVRIPCRLPQWAKGSAWMLGGLAAVWKTLRVLLLRHLTPG